MLCVEDARLRKRGHTLLPSATEPMPSSSESLRQEPPHYTLNSTPLDAETATMLVKNMLANGYTLQQLEKMGAASSSEEVAHESGLPSYKN
jgi:hypothetical protein